MRKIAVLSCQFLILALVVVTINLNPEAVSAQSTQLPGSQSAVNTPPLPTFPVFNAPFVARVYFVDDAELNRLAATLDVWTVRHDDGYLIAQVTPIQFARLKRAGVHVALDQEHSAHTSQLRAAAQSAQQGIPGLACYRTVEETYADLAKLAADHPALARWTDVGDSWAKVRAGNATGYDIYTLVLTNQATSGPKPRFFLMAAIHAREMATAELATRFAEYLVTNYNHDPDITWLLDYHELHIMPVANPDGRKIAERGVLWRKNTNDTDGCTDEFLYGVDLNRNSSFKWNQCVSFGCSSANSCDIVYRGSGPASEPETQVIQKYAASIFPDMRGPNDIDAAPADASGLLISLHSFSELVLFPWGWTTQPAPNHAQLQTLGRKFGYYTGYRTCQSGAPGCIYQTDGTTDDWSYGELGVPSYTFELGTEFFERCDYFENTIIDENLPALLYGFKAARRPYQSPAGPEVVSITSGIGGVNHLQAAALPRANVTATTVISSSVVTLQATVDDTRYNSNGEGDEDAQPIRAARYSLNAPSWITDTATYTMTAADGAFNSSREVITAIIDTSGLPLGRHTVFVEGQDADGNWGVPSATFLQIVDAAAPPGRYGAEATATPATGESYRAKTVKYALTVTNTGTVTDTFALAVGGQRWATTIPEKAGPVPSMGTIDVALAVQIPVTATAGMTDTVMITVSSISSGQTVAKQPITTRAIPYLRFLPFMPNDD